MAAYRQFTSDCNSEARDAGRKARHDNLRAGRGMAGIGGNFAVLRNEPNPAQSEAQRRVPADFSWIGFTGGRRSGSRSGFPPVTAHLPETAIIPRAGWARNRTRRLAVAARIFVLAPYQFRRGTVLRLGSGQGTPYPYNGPEAEPVAEWPRFGWRWREFRRITKRTQSCAKRDAAPISRRFFLDWLYRRRAKLEQERVSAGDGEWSRSGHHSAGGVGEE